MKIKSQFYDYYDDVSYIHGQNSSNIWVRTGVRKTIPNGMELYDRWSYSTPEKEDHEFQVVIGFCGTIYSGIKIKRYKKRNGLFLNKTFWSLEEYIDFKSNNRSFFFGEKEHNLRQRAEPWFYTKEDNTLFYEHNCPIFVATNRYGLHIHSLGEKQTESPLTLSAFNFQSIKTPELAYTEITGYIGDLGASYKPVPEMDNKTKINSHGFTKKSFRTA